MIENWEVISEYSRKQALEDGVLISINQLASEAGFQYPVAITVGVMSLIEQACEDEKYCNDIDGVLWDILWMCKNEAHQSKDRCILFQVIITGLGRKKCHTFKAVCGPGDNMEPVVTIMLPFED